MKISIRKMLVVSAIVLSFTAVQAVWAIEVTVKVTGTIERIGQGSIDLASIDVLAADGMYTFYDIPSDVLLNLIMGDTVTVEAYKVTFPNGMLKYIAYSITKGEVTYSWHPNVPKVGNKGGTETVTLSATDENGQPCYCQCIENTVCYECNCYCGPNR